MAFADVRHVAYGKPARRAVAAAIAAAKRDDPLAPVTVAVPNAYAGLSLRRWLATTALPGRDRPGIANVRFMALARVTELLGAPGLAAEGRTPLLAAFRAEAVRATVAANPGPFGDVAQLRSTLRSIDASFRDLSQASETGLDAVARLNERARHMVDLFRDFRRRTAGCYDDHDLARAASEAISIGSAALAGLGDLIVYLPDRLPPAQREFVQTVMEHQGVEIILGLTGDPSVDAKARAEWDLVDGTDGASAAVEMPCGTVIVSVADPEEEVREAVRRIGARMRRGTPLHRMAIVYRNENPYRLIAGEQLSAAGIPWNGPSIKALGQTPAGRALLGFLDVQREQFSRAAITEWLSSAPILDPGTGEIAPGYEWAMLARRAGVTKGAEQWDERLTRHAETLRAELERIARHDDDPERRTRHIEGELAGLEALRAFVSDVREHAKAPADGSWAAFAEWADDVLRRYIRAAADWPDDEVEAFVAVQEVLTQLSGLDTLAGTPDLAVFRTAVEQALERPAGRTGNFGNGVFVGRLADVAGLELGTVFVLGMNEGAFPPTPREDPLVRDEEREVAGLQRTSARAVAERRQYLAALSSAEERVLIFPRADLRGQRASLPSAWLLETASHFAGARVYASNIEENAGQPWLDAPPSFESAILSDHEPAHVQEFDTRSLRRWHLANREPGEHYLAADAPLMAGFDLQRGRAEEGFTRWAGSVDSSRERSPFGGAPLSATALQDWAVCPFRYFAGRVLNVEEPDEEDDELAISALNKGSLIHEVLERFFSEARRLAQPADAWTDDDRELLRRLAGDLFRKAESDGRVGHPFVWQSERGRILADLDEFLERDLKLRTELNTVQTASELSFGLDGSPGLEVEVSPAKTLRLRGRIDRTDEGAGDGKIVVIDYKTGKVKPAKNQLDRDPVVAGTYLQLPIYAEAVSPGRNDVESYYWFVTDKAKFVRRGYAVTDHHRKRLREVLDVIGTGIEEGVFPPNPGEPDDASSNNCEYCAFDRLCPASRKATWRRARADAALRDYVGLRDYGAVDD